YGLLRDHRRGGGLPRPHWRRRHHYLFQRLERQLVELPAALGNVLQQPLPHAARPELVDVIGYSLQRCLPVGLGAEEAANVVRHTDDLLRAVATHLTDTASAAFNKLSCFAEKSRK